MDGIVTFFSLGRFTQVFALLGMLGRVVPTFAFLLRFCWLWGRRLQPWVDLLLAGEAGKHVGKVVWLVRHCEITAGYRHNNGKCKSKIVNVLSNDSTIAMAREK